MSEYSANVCGGSRNQVPYYTSPTGQQPVDPKISALAEEMIQKLVDSNQLEKEDASSNFIQALTGILTAVEGVKNSISPDKQFSVPHCYAIMAKIGSKIPAEDLPTVERLVGSMFAIKDSEEPASGSGANTSTTQDWLGK